MLRRKSNIPQLDSHRIFLSTDQYHHLTFQIFLINKFSSSVFFYHFFLKIQVCMMLRNSVYVYLETYLTNLCLFVCGSWSFSKIFHSYGVVTFTGDGLQIFIYTEHLWPLSTDGSLACHTYCDTGYPFTLVIIDKPCLSQLLLSVQQWSCYCLF